jgi:hypothetical protein
LTFQSVPEKTAGEVRLVIPKSFVDNEKLRGNDVQMQQSLINIYRKRPLSNPQNGPTHTNGQLHPDYNPHRAKPCRNALIAASYIIVLSIIPYP